MGDTARGSEGTAASERLAFLARAGEILSSSLEYETTLERIAQLTVPRLADWCAIDLLDEDGRLVNVAVAHADPTKVAWARSLQDRFPTDANAPHGPGNVVRTGEVELYPEITDDLLVEVAQSPEHLEAIRALGMTSALVVPLTARERTFGALTLISAESGLRYGEADLEFAVHIGRRAATAIDNARLYRESERSGREAEEARAVHDAFFMNSPIAKAFLDRELRYVRVNDATARLNGVPVDEHLGRSVADVLPELALTILPLMRRALTGESISDVEISGRRRSNGDLGHWLASYYPVPTATGEVLGVGVGIIDISERKRTEQALQASEARKKAIVDSALDAIVTIDDLGRVLEFNPAAELMFGFPRELMIGRELADVIVPEALRDAHRAGLARFRETGEGEVIGRRLEMPALQADGSEFQVELTVTRVELDEPDAPTLFSATLRDLTERDRMRAEREQLVLALFEAQKLEAVGRLAGGVAHDFNNLLTVILGFTDVLRRRLADPSVLHYVEQINGAAERGARLTRQMLAFSRQQVLQPQLVSLSEIVTVLEPMLEPMVGDDVELVTVLDRTLPPVLADPGQLEQVLLNLATNARDAMPDGGRLTITTAPADLDEQFVTERLLHPVPYLMLEVADTGVGMDEHTQRRLFEPFFTTKEVGKGTGLGLASSHGIIEQSGGTIEVESAPGQGARFRIYLPVADPGGPQLVRPDEGNRTTVLVVEDNDGLRELAALILEEAGYAVLAAASGSEALALAAGQLEPMHLLLTDIVMPGMSGTKLAERLRAENPGLKVIYMTGYEGNGEKEFSIPHGGELLRKPFMPEQLLERIERTLGVERRDQTAR